jgi:hypothetical protein
LHTHDDGGVDGVCTHWPAVEHVSVPAQVPQVPPQPSLPHCLPVQFGMQAHVKLVVHVSGAVQSPQSIWPPQPLPIQPHSALCAAHVVGVQLGGASGIGFGASGIAIAGASGVACICSGCWQANNKQHAIKDGRRMPHERTTCRNRETKFAVL